MTPSFSRPTRAFLSRQALLHNLRFLKKKVGPAKIQAVLKADAYGHSAALLAPWLHSHGVRSFGVATFEEALQLRCLGLRGELMILGAVDEKYLPEAAARQIGVSAWSRHFLEAAARRLKRPADFHLKVDTGMHRLGFQPEEIPGVLADFQSGRFGRLRLASAYTHLACADEARDRSSAGQLERFKALPWPAGLRLHAANSSAALRYPQARLDMVRSGLFLYGAMGPSRPVLSFRTRVLRVAPLKKGEGISYGHTFKARRNMKVATLAVGYADGLPRLLSNRGQVLIAGKRCPIVGRVCMDLTMVDLSAVKAGVHAGAEAVLLGSQGRESVSASDWARLCLTNSYEILCGISERVPREFSF